MDENWKRKKWVRVIPNGNSNAEEYVSPQAPTPTFPKQTYDKAKSKDSFPTRGRLTPYRSSTNSNRSAGSDNCINELENDDGDGDGGVKQNYVPLYPPYMSGILPPFVVKEQQAAVAGDKGTPQPPPPKSRSHMDGFVNGENEDNILHNASIIRALNHEVKVKTAGLLRANLSPVSINKARQRENSPIPGKITDDSETESQSRHRSGKYVNYKPYRDIINTTDNTKTNGKLLASPEVPYVDESICGERGSSQNGTELDKNDSGCHTGSHNDPDCTNQDGVQNEVRAASDNQDRDLKGMVVLKLDSPTIPELPYSPSVLIKNRRKRRPLIIPRKPSHKELFYPSETPCENVRPDKLYNKGNPPYLREVSHSNDRSRHMDHYEQTTVAKSGIYPVAPEDETDVLGRDSHDAKINSTQFSLSSLPEVLRRGEGTNSYHRLPLSPTFPPTFYKTTQNPEHNIGVKAPPKVLRLSRGMPVHLYAVTDPSRQAFYGILSYLYGLFLIVMGAVLPLAEVFTPKVSYMFYEGFYLYLYCGSILFLLYAYCFLLNKKRIIESRVAEEFYNDANHAKLKRRNSNRSEKIYKNDSNSIKINGVTYKGCEGQIDKLATLQEEVNSSADGIDNVNENSKRARTKVMHKINGGTYINTLEREKTSRLQLKKTRRQKRNVTCCGKRKNAEDQGSSDSSPPPTPEGVEGMNGLENGSALEASMISGHMAGAYMGHDFDERLENLHDDINGVESTTIPLLDDNAMNHKDDTLSDNDLITTTKKAHVFESDYSPHTGSFYLRMGAVAFATGSMIFNGLKFGQSFELATNPPCFNIFRGILPLMHLIFTFIQLYFIFLNSKMCINKYKVFAKFGLMHMLATNVCVFLSTIIKETVHDIVFKGLYAYPAQVNVTLPSSSNISMISSCRQNYMMGNIVKDASPYLYPCNVEYSFICASILYVMWSNIGSYKNSDSHVYKSIKNLITLDEEQKYETVISTQNPITPCQSQVDCKGSSKGLFAGILTLVMCIICLILFFVLIKNPLYSEVAFFMSSCSEITVYALTIIAILISLIKTKWNRKEGSKKYEQNLVEDFSKINKCPLDTAIGWYDRNGYYIDVLPRNDGHNKRGAATKDYYYRFSNVDNTLESTRPPNSNYGYNAETKTEGSREYIKDSNKNIGQESLEALNRKSDHISEHRPKLLADGRNESFQCTKPRRVFRQASGRRTNHIVTHQKRGLGDLDCLLQYMSIIGEYLLAGFSIVATYRSLKAANNEAILVMTTAILSTIQVTCQTVFLLDQFSNSYMTATSPNQPFVDGQEKANSIASHGRNKSGSYLHKNRGRHQMPRSTQAVEMYSNLSNRTERSQSSDITNGKSIILNCEVVKYQSSKLPPRQLVTFLLVANLALWAVDTFAIERAKANPVQSVYFGPLVWSIITHACVPLIIFYRFHSSICLAEIWKACYVRHPY